jgi:hypothetical protein
MVRTCNDQTCSNCKFWKEYVQSGTCQKHPPVIVPTGNEYVTRFPVTNSDDWCGEHEYSSHHWKDVEK